MLTENALCCLKDFFKEAIDLFYFLTSKPKSEPKRAIRVEGMKTSTFFGVFTPRPLSLMVSASRKVFLVEKSEQVTTLKMLPFHLRSSTRLTASLMVCPLLTTTASFLSFDLNSSLNEGLLAIQINNTLS